MLGHYTTRPYSEHSRSPQTGAARSRLLPASSPPILLAHGQFGWASAGGAVPSLTPRRPPFGVNNLVAPGGFEPPVSALRGLRPWPLDDGARLLLSTHIPTDGTRTRTPPPWCAGPGSGRGRFRVISAAPPMPHVPASVRVSPVRSATPPQPGYVLPCSLSPQWVTIPRSLA